MALRHFLCLSGLLCLLYVFSLTGCVPLAASGRKEGFRAMQRGFESLQVNPHLNEVIVLKNVKVHIVGSRRFFHWKKAAAYGSPVLGYATSRNEIYVFGRMAGGKIIVNQGILGHEITHLLHYRNSRVANPDKLEDLGA